MSNFSYNEGLVYEMYAAHKMSVSSCFERKENLYELLNSQPAHQSD